MGGEGAEERSEEPPETDEESESVIDEQMREEAGRRKKEEARKGAHITLLVQPFPPRTSRNVPSSDDEVLHVELEVGSVVDLLGYGFESQGGRWNNNETKREEPKRTKSARQV